MSKIDDADGFAPWAVDEPGYDPSKEEAMPQGKQPKAKRKAAPKPEPVEPRDDAATFEATHDLGPKTTGGTREAWLVDAMHQLTPVFADAGYPLPGKIRMTCGQGYGKAIKVLGTCYPDSMSADETFEIFIGPQRSDPFEVLGVLVHELLHAALPGKGHGKEFRKGCEAMGLDLKDGTKVANILTQKALDDYATSVVDECGFYPHAPLQGKAKAEGEPKKQTTRMIKCECPACGYTLRTVKKWLDLYGAPLCPAEGGAHGQMNHDAVNPDGEPQEGQPE